jgi:hypothetical protein
MLYVIQLILGTKANATKNSRGWQIVGLRRAGFTQNVIFRDLVTYGHQRRQHEMIAFCIAFVEVTE